MSDVLRVVLVDDEPDLRHLLGRLLARAGGFEVVGEAANGRDALTVIAETEPDAVVLDLSMPVMDGLAVLEELQGHDQRPRIVVLSGFGSRDVADQALALGATHYLEKGRGFGDLADVLRG